MTLLITKTQILTGIYTGKEILFFFIGLSTLIITPVLHTDVVGTLQLLILGAALFLEGLSSIIEIGFNFITENIIPWYNNIKAKRKMKVV